MTPILSICICSLFKRAGSLAVLLRSLEEQAERFPGQVEFVVICDDGEESTGAKRNKAYRQAIGTYVASVDDDDDVSPWYVEEILKAAQQSPDAIAMNGTMTTDGGIPDTWDIRRSNPYATLSKGANRKHYVRFHNHLSPIRRSIALQFPFPDQYVKEDYEFAKALHLAKAIKSEVVIKRPMYHYKYVSIK